MGVEPLSVRTGPVLSGEEDVVVSVVTVVVVVSVVVVVVAVVVSTMFTVRVTVTLLPSSSSALYSTV